MCTHTVPGTFPINHTIHVCVYPGTFWTKQQSGFNIFGVKIYIVHVYIV